MFWRDTMLICEWQKNFSLKALTYHDTVSLQIYETSKAILYLLYNKDIGMYKKFFDYYFPVV